MPFPTSLLGEHILTDHAAPAVILYNSTMALQAVGWILIGHASLKGKLGKSEKANEHIRKNRQYGVFAFLLYSSLAVLAIWFPFTVAVITTLTWIFWLILGFNLKHE